MDSGQTRNSRGPNSNSSVAVRGSTNPEGENHQAKHRRIRSHCLMPRLQRNENQQKAQAHSDRCRVRMEECLRIPPHGAERLDGRTEVINEALAETGGEQRKKRSDETAAAIPEPEPAESAARDLRQNPIESEPNPKRSLLISQRRQQPAAVDGKGRRGQSVTDTEPRIHTGDPLEMGTGESRMLPGAPSANTRRRIVVKSEPVAVTTQEAADGYREKATRRESN